MSLVTRTDADNVTTLTLNRPEKLNALTPTMFSELRAHIDAIAANERIACVVLSGAGRAFSAGHDLNTIGIADNSPDRYLEPETIDALEALPQPTIAKLHGYCLTGALELALACDLLVATADTLIGDTHGQWGLVPVWGMSVRLPERVGAATAKRLMYTSQRLTAAEALQIGLVDYVFDHEQLDAGLSRLVSEICANSTGTNRTVKALLAAARTQTRSAALVFERSLPYGRPADRHERMSRTAGEDLRR
jgi:enoyl-CoA hydratase/carnithine racemase